MNYTLKELQQRVNKLIERQEKMHTVPHGFILKRMYVTSQMMVMKFILVRIILNY